MTENNDSTFRDRDDVIEKGGKQPPNPPIVATISGRPPTPPMEYQAIVEPAPATSNDGGSTPSS